MKISAFISVFGSNTDSYHLA